MAKDIIARYVWIVDTLMRHGALTRKRLNELWKRSQYSDGNDLPERTFFKYRRAIEENFQIDIKCNSEGEYYIPSETTPRQMSVINWLLDSLSAASAIRSSSTLEGRIEVEDVPSAREFLPQAVHAVSQDRKIRFTYAGYKRLVPERGIVFHPFQLKRYKQRWYMVGLKENGKGITDVGSRMELRTYALDRVKEMEVLDETFRRVSEAVPGKESIFSDVIGVTTSRYDTCLVRIKATPMQAKYFRDLPLHPSQMEEICDEYSIFSYKLKINYELVHEILALGSTVQVLEPPELVARVREELKETLKHYNVEC